MDVLQSNAFGHLLSHKASIDDYAALAFLGLAGLAFISKGSLWSKPDPFAYKLYERPQELEGADTAQRQSRDISIRLQESAADIAVLWASQSGTAEQFARRLTIDLTRSMGAKAIMLDVSEIDPESYTKLSQDSIVIFLASTFGEGDPSDNMHELYSWLAGNHSLPELRYIAFGLGNSNYKHYNHVIDFLVERFTAGGAKALMPVGKADDANGETEENFLEWKEILFEFMQTRLGYQRQILQYEPTVEIVEAGAIETQLVHRGRPMESLARQSSHQQKIFALPIREKQELFHSDSGRNCLHLELDLGQHAELKYKTGDYIGIWPVNPVDEVERLVVLLGIQHRRTSPIHIKSIDGSALKVPSITTIDALLGHYLEICGPVSREHVARLASLAPTKAARTFLDELSRDKSTFQRFVADNHVNLGRLLKRACQEPGSWSTIPLPLLVEVLRPIQPRYYSISSSSVVQPRRVAVTAVVSNTILPEGHLPGLTTNYMLGLTAKCASDMTESHLSAPQPLPSGHVHACLRKSAFKLPVVASTPIIMVGAGTGVAPFRAFLQERARLKTMGREVGKSVLFFGCRNQDHDFIYRSEFSELASTLGDRFTMHTAFSRPSEPFEPKQYVQHRMLQESVDVGRLLVDGNAYFYVCGSAAMARDVSNSVNEILAATQRWSATQVEDFVSRQRRQKRWLQDVWG